MGKYYITPQSGAGDKHHMHGAKPSQTADSHQTSPYWVACVIPFKHRTTTDQELIAGTRPSTDMDVSKKETRSERMTTTAPLIISDHVLSWSIYHAKQSPMGSLTMTLSLAAGKQFEQMGPGDWILFWAVESEAAYNEVKENIKNLRAANDFHSGLKFVGKIHGTRTARSISPDGVISRSYTVSCQSFSESMNTFPYTEAFSSAVSSSLSSYLKAFFSLVDENVTKAATDQGLPLDKVENDLIDVLWGPGPGLQVFDPSTGPMTEVQAADFEAERLVQSSNPIKPCLVPATVCKLLGFEAKEDMHFAKVISREIGIENSNGAEDGPNIFLLEQGKGLISTNYKTLINQSVLMSGSAWDIITQHSGYPIMECFTGIRYTRHPSGKTGILPTVKLRQIPFSSELLALKISGIDVTRYREIPAWVLDERLVFTEDLGRNDSSRANYIFATGMNPNIPSQAQMSYQLEIFRTNPPLIDLTDIERHGIKKLQFPPMFMFFDPTRKEKPPFQKLLADAYMNMHNRLEGQIVTVGIQEPIQPGDNLEYRGVLYHIEGLSMSGQINTYNGEKGVRTIFRVTRGEPVKNISEADAWRILEEGAVTATKGQTVTDELVGTNSESAVDEKTYNENIKDLPWLK